MNGHSISHWGIILFPDNGHARNIQLNTDGSIEKLDNDKPAVLCGRIGLGGYDIRFKAGGAPYFMTLPHSPAEKRFEKTSLFNNESCHRLYR